MDILQHLMSLADRQYQSFHSKLIPTVPPENIIGVRTPVLRKFARQLYRDEKYESFIRTLPHHFYEENNLHAFIVEQFTDYQNALHEVDRFLPFVDNWATCDAMSPKIFRNHRSGLLAFIKQWIQNDHPFAVRYGIKMLMDHFLDEDFDPKYLSLAARIHSDEYYVNMMVAWYFATALAKQYDETIDIIRHRQLSPWIHAKTIQKALESRRITDSQKALLRAMKSYEEAESM